MATQKQPLKSEIQAQLDEALAKLAEAEEKLKSQSANTDSPTVVYQQAMEWSTYPVNVVQLMRGGTELYYGSGDNKNYVGYLSGPGSSLTIPFSDLQRVINVMPFTRYFHELGILINDDAVIDRLNLRQYYNKYGVNGKADIDKIFDLKVDEFEKKVKILPSTLKCFVIYRCLIGINEEDSRFAKLPIQKRLENMFHLPDTLANMAKRIKIKTKAEEEPENN